MAFIINPLVNINGTPAALTGLNAAKPASGSQHGTLYFARDTQEIYQWNQLTLAWVLMGSGTGGGATPSWEQTLAVNDSSVLAANLISDAPLGFRNSSSGASAFIRNLPLGNFDNNYYYPDKLGAPDPDNPTGEQIIAMLSDIPLRGQYSPTVGNFVNCSTVTLFPVQYKIMRDTVLMWGRIDMRGLAINQISSFTMDIPFNPLASNFLNDYETAGTGASNGLDAAFTAYPTEVMNIRAITGLDRIFFQWLCNDDSTDHLFNFHLNYIVPGTL